MAVSTKIKRSKLLLGSLFLSTVLGLSLLVNSATVHANFFKCVDNTGSVTYTSEPCPTEESTQLISKTASVLPGLDCHVAEKFAEATTQRMLAGESSDDLITSFGGVDYLSSFIVNLVGYVYTFKETPNTTAERIVQLTKERCEVGTFGSDGHDCGIYPSQFLDDIGGCVSAEAKKKEENIEKYTSIEAPLSKPAEYPALPASSSSDSSNNTRGVSFESYGEKESEPLTNSSGKLECQQRIAATLQETHKQIVDADTSPDKRRLQARYRQLENQLNRC